MLLGMTSGTHAPRGQGLRVEVLHRQCIRKKVKIFRFRRTARQMRCERCGNRASGVRREFVLIRGGMMTDTSISLRRFLRLRLHLYLNNIRFWSTNQCVNYQWYKILPPLTEVVIRVSNMIGVDRCRFMEIINMELPYEALKIRVLKISG